MSLLVGCAADTGGPASEAPADDSDEARAAIEEVLSTYRAASSYSHVCTWSTETTKGDDGEPWGSEHGAATRFLFERPDRFVVESADHAIYCDGETMWTWDRERDEYVAMELADAEPPPFGLLGVVEVVCPAAESAYMLLVGIQDPHGGTVEPLLSDDATYSIEEEARKGLDGRWVRVASPSSDGPLISLWIDDDTGLVLAWEMTMTSYSGLANDDGELEMFRTRMSIACREVELDPDIPGHAFSFRPDAGAREVHPTPAPSDD